MVSSFITDALVGLAIVTVSGALLWWGLTYRGGAK